MGQQLETKLDEVFRKNGPKMSEGARKWLVRYLPWITLVVGVLSLWLAYGLWLASHALSTAVDYLNQYSAIYGGPITTTPDMTLVVWLALSVLIIDAVLYIAAFPGLRDHRKTGWNFLYWALLLNVVYAVVALFTGYDGFSRFLGGLIGSVIGFWVIFQIRGAYVRERVPRSRLER